MTPFVLQRRAFLLATTALLAARPVRAANDPLSRISAARSSLRTLRGRFVQERVLGLLATSVTSTGEVILVRPDRLRWRLDPPDAITYWVTPAGMAYASKTSRGSVDRDAAGLMGTVLSDLLVALGGDLSSLAARYTLAASELEDRGLRVTAEPRDPALARRVRRIRIDVAPDLVSPREIVLEESDTDRAHLRFREVQRDVVVDPALMQPGAGWGGV